MPQNNKRYGNFEYGDVYDYDKETQSRSSNCIGKLIVDADKERFYIKPPGKASKAIPHDRVNWMLANDLIDFYHEESREFLIDFMMRIERNREELKEHQRKRYADQKAAEILKANTKLVKKTRFRARISKAVWVLGCFVLIGVGVLCALPTPEPAPAEESIAGVGMRYPVSGDILEDATYMQAFGNGSELYGIVMDNTIIESGQQNSNDSPIKENVMINATVSQDYPIHMRPLYYDKSSFYQSQLVLNDAEQGSSGVLLQNPNGYSLGKAANELVLFGGRGMGSVILSSPENYQALSASDAASAIEQAQQEAARSYQQGGSDDDYGDEDYTASEMPAGWNGYDHADIDDDMVVASYWYTKNSTLNKEDLKRRIVIIPIEAVYNQGADGIGAVEPIQMNYQDKDSDFYAPVVSASPISNGSAYWVGYMKRSANGEEGFFIRKYENAEDILAESYDNTFSTKDLTGNEYPITNYQLNGDRLFFEQQGYIWVIDLSKASIEVNGAQRTIKKENPIQICKSTEIRPTVSRDEQFLASVNNETTVPVSHYQVVTMTTAGGKIIYGIAFIEADSGNLVFQPCNGASVATAERRKGAGGDTSSLDVSSSDQAALEKALEEEARQQNQNQDDDADLVDTGEEEEPEELEEGIISDADSIVDLGTGETDAIQQDIAQQAYTLTQASSEDGVDNGRILIKAGSPEIQIVCFCVRGEQFYWIEQDESSLERKVMCSPIYYKNDASRLVSDAFEQIGDNGEVIKDADQATVQSDQAGQADMGGATFSDGASSSPDSTGAAGDVQQQDGFARSPGATDGQDGQSLSQQSSAPTPSQQSIQDTVVDGG